MPGDYSHSAWRMDTTHTRMFDSTGYSTPAFGGANAPLTAGFPRDPSPLMAVGPVGPVGSLGPIGPIGPTGNGALTTTGGHNSGSAEFASDSVDDLLSCIMTWQHNPAPGTLVTTKPGPCLVPVPTATGTNADREFGFGIRTGHVMPGILPPHLQRPPKRPGDFFDTPTDTRTVFRNIGANAPCGVRMQAPPQYHQRQHPAAAGVALDALDLAACAAGGTTFAGLERRSSVRDSFDRLPSFSSGNRSLESDGGFGNSVMRLYNTPCLPAPSGDLDELVGTPRLVYLTSSENLGEERLSDSEENPFLSVGIDRTRKTVITPRDILIYGRNGSFHTADGPYLPDSDPQGARMLQDVSLNCQLEQMHVAVALHNPRRLFKQRVNHNANVEEFAQMASEMEKVRGVCYCRSDNSWTAWWTEKGRNRKKAFKVTRFGFHEARERAIEHRLAVEEKLPELRTKRSPKSAAAAYPTESEIEGGSASGSAMGASPLGTSPSISPVLLPRPALSPPHRMQTRGRHGRNLDSTPVDELDLSSASASCGPFLGALSPSSAGGATRDGHSTTQSAACEESEGSPGPYTRGRRRPAAATRHRDDFDLDDEEDEEEEQRKFHTPASATKSGSSRASLNSSGSTTEGLSVEPRESLSICTTTESPEFPSHSVSDTPQARAPPCREDPDLVTLDAASARSVEVALACLAAGRSVTRLPTGETVRVLPHLCCSSQAEGESSRVTVVLIRHP